MLLPRTFLYSAAVAVAALLPGLSAIGAPTAADRATEMLANFPQLRKLGTQDEASVRAYLTTVAKAYRAAGYVAFARRLPEAAPLVVLFGKPERGESPAALRRARATLRTLQQAMDQSDFVGLPAVLGKSVPDYFRIGKVFLNNAGLALKNLNMDRNVSDSLRQKTATFWLAKTGDHTFKFLTSAAGITTSGNFTTSSSSDGATLYVGGSFYDSSSLTASAASSISGGTQFFNDGTALVASVAGSISGGTQSFTSTSRLDVGSIQGVGGLITTTFTPDGAGTFSGAFSAMNLVVESGVVTLSNDATFEPETTFAEATWEIHLAGGDLILPGTEGTHWLALAVGAPLPDGPCGQYVIALDQPYTVNGVDFATGTEIYRVDDGFVTPDGATALPDEALTAVVDGAATPTPTPDPSPTP